MLGGGRTRGRGHELSQCALLYKSEAGGCVLLLGRVVRECSLVSGITLQLGGTVNHFPGAAVLCRISRWYGPDLGVRLGGCLLPGACGSGVRGGLDRQGALGFRGVEGRSVYPKFVFTVKGT